MLSYATKFFLSEGIVKNRYLPMAFQFWLLYGGSDRNPPLPYETDLANPETVGNSSTFPQQVSGVANWGIRFDMSVTETGPSCMGTIR